MQGQVTYDYSFSPDHPNNTAAAVYRMARAGGKRVLDLGSGQAIVSGQLARDDGCSVTCVDNNPQMLALAAGRGVARTIHADLEGASWMDELDGPYDVVILADVLEHLVDPGRVLDAVRDRFLADEGFLVVSIPNASHEAVVAQMMGGRFTYRETGILDATHLRFFTVEELTRLAEAHGFEVRDLHRTTLALEETEMREDVPSLPGSVRQEILEHIPEARTYQFVCRLQPQRAGAARGESMWDGVGARSPEILPDAAFAAMSAAAKGCRSILAVGDSATRAARLIVDEVVRTEVADLGGVPAGSTYDVVILGDLLERTARPGALLQDIRDRSMLAADGTLIAVTTNSSSWEAVAEFFPSHERIGCGIVGTDRLRFYTRTSLQELFEGYGFIVRTFDSIPVGTSPSPSLPPTVRRYLDSTADGAAAFFVARAEPASESQELARVRDENSRLLRRMAAERSAFDAMRADMVRSHEDLKAKLERSRATAERQRKQITQMRNSRAWRLARSMTAATRAVRNPVGALRSRKSKRVTSDIDVTAVEPPADGVNGRPSR